MARFLQTAKGENSLGNSRDFRHARSVMPLDRGDAVFVYFSDAFFRKFTGPAYRIESLRRLEAATDIEIVQLAKLNAATESMSGKTIEDLLSAACCRPALVRGPMAAGPCWKMARFAIRCGAAGVISFPCPTCPFSKSVRRRPRAMPASWSMPTKTGARWSRCWWD